MSRSFREATNLFVWSTWGEIGVPSSERRPFEISIDLEALIHLTDAVGASDPRLGSHAKKWMDSFPELVSKARLKRFGGDVSEPLARSSRAISMSGRATLDIAGAPALQLRIRSALGVSARAEIIRHFVLDTPQTRRSSADLAQACGYSKRNVEKALESLERAGWVTRIRGGSALHWSVADHGTFHGLFSPVPVASTSFVALAKIVESMQALDDVGARGERVRSATARELLASQQPTADWGAVSLPVPTLLDDAWEVALSWLSGLPGTAS